jgi:PIN domain nuclease of toxin-antitoxin system
MLTLDTHIVVALLNGELTDRERELVAGDTLAISDIVLWELAKLVELGRLELDFDDVEFRTFLRSVTVLPITIEIARASTTLDFKSDPADEIISATAIVEESPLLTRDRRILKSSMVPRPA